MARAYAGGVAGSTHAVIVRHIAWRGPTLVEPGGHVSVLPTRSATLPQWGESRSARAWRCRGSAFSAGGRAFVPALQGPARVQIGGGCQFDLRREHLAASASATPRRCARPRRSGQRHVRVVATSSTCGSHLQQSKIARSDVREDLVGHGSTTSHGAVMQAHQGAGGRVPRDRCTRRAGARAERDNRRARTRRVGRRDAFHTTAAGQQEAGRFATVRKSRTVASDDTQSPGGGAAEGWRPHPRREPPDACRRSVTVDRSHQARRQRLKNSQTAKTSTRWKPGRKSKTHHRGHPRRAPA